MKYPIGALILITLLASRQILFALPLSDAERAARVEALRQATARDLDGCERAVGRANPTPSTRDLTAGALAELVLGRSTEEAEKMLRLYFAQQDMDPQSPRYGSVPWQIGHPEITDANADEFGMLAVGPIMLQYGGRLSPALREEMTPHIRAAFAALRRRTFRTPAYTNIFLMRAVDLVLAGEAIGDTRAADDGDRQLDEWLAYTRQGGIHEFDSPTYYGADLNSLGLGYLLATRPGARAKFQAMLDLVWTDIAANYFPARKTLSGPHSRDYHFLHGGGMGDIYLYEEGLQDALTTDHVGMERIYAVLSTSAGAYRPAASILALAQQSEKLVRQRWDPGADHDRTQYITPDFTIGSAGPDYGSQDTLFAIELASPKDLPTITIQPETLDSPYGLAKMKDGSGHMKPFHLPLRPVSVQERGTVLSLLDIDPTKTKTGTGVFTSVILPAAADELWLDGKRVLVGQAFSLPANLQSVVGVREGKAGVAIRLFHADGSEGPEIALRGDAEGLAVGAVRLTIVHSHHPPPEVREKGFRVGLLCLAARCETEADFRELMDRAAAARIEEGGEPGRTWTAAARLPGLLLEAGQELEKGRPLYRRIKFQSPT